MHATSVQLVAVPLCAGPYLGTVPVEPGRREFTCTVQVQVVLSPAPPFVRSKLNPPP